MGEAIKFPGSLPEKLSSGGGNGGNMEARVAKLESDVDNIKTGIADIKTDLRDMRKDHRADLRMLIGFHITTLICLIGLLIKVFSN